MTQTFITPAQLQFTDDHGNAWAIYCSRMESTGPRTFQLQTLDYELMSPKPNWAYLLYPILSSKPLSELLDLVTAIEVQQDGCSYQFRGFLKSIQLASNYWRNDNIWNLEVEALPHDYSHQSP